MTLKKLKKPKKRIIEEAIDVVAEASGCWNREESPEETAARSRKAITDNFRRSCGVSGPFPVCMSGD